MNPDKLGRQFHQLTMFETARDLRGGGVGKFLPADLDQEVEDWSEVPEDSMEPDYRPETEEEGWDRKSEEADESGLTEHIAEHPGGVARPVDLSVGSGGHARGTIMNGHHRVAAQYDVNPDALVPVSWTDRQYPGSEGRKTFPMDKTRPVVGPKWNHEDVERIGFERRQY